MEAFPPGKPLSAALIPQAQATALTHAAPFKYNATKIEMAKSLLVSRLEKADRTTSAMRLRGESTGAFLLRAAATGSPESA